MKHSVDLDVNLSYFSREFSDSKVKESPYPDVVLPEVSAASYVLENMKKYGDNIAFVSSKI